MKDKDVQILKKLQEHILAILDYCKDFSDCDAFQGSPMAVDATVFNLMQIGELAKMSLSDEAKDQIPSIPWKQIYGMRNRIVHGYSGVNLSIVWDTVSNDIPAIQKELAELLGAIEG